MNPTTSTSTTPSINSRTDDSKRPMTHQQFMGLQEIEKYQSYPGVLIRRPDFQAMLRDMVKHIDPDLRFQSAAMALLQEAAEAHTVQVLHESQTIAEHNNRITTLPKDIKLAMALREMHNHP